MSETHVVVQYHTHDGRQARIYMNDPAYSLRHPFTGEVVEIVSAQTSAERFAKSIALVSKTSPRVSRMTLAEFNQLGYPEDKTSRW